jgi:cytochrome c oxidase cbb3-type subunit IV
MVSGIITALLLVLFVAGGIWAYSPGRRQDFDAAARLPLDDDSHPGTPEEETGR